MHFHDTSDPLLTKILGRSHSLFMEDVETHLKEIIASVQGKRILILGASGAIGSTFTRQLLTFCSPATLHLVDLSENGLVEVVRDLRASAITVCDDFQTFCIDIRAREFGEFIDAMHTYDYILNFAAMKHVRSERDPFTLSRMIDTNVFSVLSLLSYLKESGKGRRFFSVSSDKSVRSANLMGGTKALMEKVMWAFAQDIPATSARFANVAFSSGSLLDGFNHRMLKRQPLSAPSDTRRYFISHEEAGHLCLLAAFLGQSRDVLVPRFESDESTMTFSQIAEVFLEHHNYQPVKCSSESEAIAMSEELANLETHEWPCFFAPTDTSGEKDIEEFYAATESVDSSRFREIDIVREPVLENPNEFFGNLENLRISVSSGACDLGDLRQQLYLLVPDLEHIVRDRDLDSKM